MACDAYCGPGLAVNDRALDVGRRMRPLGPIERTIAAPPETVFDVIASPYLDRTPRAMQEKLNVWERGSDMAVAAHLTTRGRLTTTTVETVRFERPRRVSFRRLRGPVPHVVETYELRAAQRGTAFSTPATSAPTGGRSAARGATAWRRRGNVPSRPRSIPSPPRPNGAPLAGEARRG